MFDAATELIVPPPPSPELSPGPAEPEHPSATPPRYRSALERKVAAQLEARGVPVRYEPIAIEFTKRSTGTRQHVYRPDFELPGGIYIECKGLLRPEDQRKLQLIREQHPELDLRIVFEDATKVLPDGWLNKRASYAAWADRYEFPWATGGKVLDEWFPQPKHVIKPNCPCEINATPIDAIPRDFANSNTLVETLKRNSVDAPGTCTPGVSWDTPRISPLPAEGVEIPLPTAWIRADPQYQYRSEGGRTGLYNEKAISDHKARIEVRIEAGQPPFDPLLAAFTACASRSAITP